MNIDPVGVLIVALGPVLLVLLLLKLTGAL